MKDHSFPIEKITSLRRKLQVKTPNQNFQRIAHHASQAEHILLQTSETDKIIPKLQDKTCQSHNFQKDSEFTLIERIKKQAFKEQTRTLLNKEKISGF